MPVIPFVPAFAHPCLTDDASIFAAIGDGDANAGREYCRALAERAIHARRKHPRYARSNFHALAVIWSEYSELCRAVASESEARQLDEALDVAVTAMRFYGKEWQI